MADEDYGDDDAFYFDDDDYLYVEDDYAIAVSSCSFIYPALRQSRTRNMILPSPREAACRTYAPEQQRNTEMTLMTCENVRRELTSLLHRTN